MEQDRTFKVIARVHSDFASKFGVPRQSGLVESLMATVVFEPEYRNSDALRGIDKFSHIWLIWSFSECERSSWSPTVRPPRLGGNTRLGVFATRSPYRPNAVGLSSVRLESVEVDANLGSVLHISGADLIDGTPIFDIKPYLPSVDCHITATDGFADLSVKSNLRVTIPDSLLSRIPTSKQQTLVQVLALDPRPAYHNDPLRVYGFEFAGFEVKFTVTADMLEVCDIITK